MYSTTQDWFKNHIDKFRRDSFLSVVKLETVFIARLLGLPSTAFNASCCQVLTSAKGGLPKSIKSAEWLPRWLWNLSLHVSWDSLRDYTMTKWKWTHWQCSSAAQSPIHTSQRTPSSPQRCYTNWIIPETLINMSKLNLLYERAGKLTRVLYTDKRIRIFPMVPITVPSPNAAM